jgi:serine/threonine-protein kinase RsbW
MNLNQLILVSFISIVGLILLSGFLVKVFYTKMQKKTGPIRQEAKKIDLVLRAEIFELTKLAIVLEDLERYDIPVKTILELNIIIEEVFTSIVSYKVEGSKGEKVFITLSLEAGNVIVTIKDMNEEFDPTVIPVVDLNAPLEEISFRGLSFHMVRHLADEMNYQRMKDQNILTIKKIYKAL